MANNKSLLQSVDALHSATAMPEFEADILNRMSDGFLALDKAWRVVSFNQKGAEIFNRSDPQSLIGKHLWHEYPATVGSAFYDAFHKAFATQKEIDLEVYWERAQRWFNLRIYPAQEGLTVYFTDITAHMSTETRLQEAEGRLRLAVNAAQVGLWDWDLNTNQIYFSPEWKQMIGYEDHEIPNEFSEWETRVQPDDLKRVLPMVQNYINNPQDDYQTEFRFRHKDGSYRWILAQGDLFYDADGKPVRMLGSHIDITKLKQAESSLENSERRFRTLIEKSADCIITYNLQGNLLYVSPTITPLLGYTTEEMHRHSLIGLVHPDDVDASHQHYAWLLAHPGEARTREVRIRHKNGQWRTFQSTSRNLQDDPAIGAIVTNFHDITERKVAEEALEASERRFRTLIEKSLDVILLCDVANKPFYVSPSITTLLGYEADVLLQLEQSALVHPDDVETIHLDYQWLLNHPGETTTSRIRIRHQDGSWRVLRKSTRNLLHEPAINAIVSNLLDITQRVQAEDVARKYNQRLKLLHQIDRDIIAASSPKAIVDEVLKSIRHVISCQDITLLLFNEDISQGTVFATETVGVPAVPVNTQFSFVKNWHWEQVKSGQGLVISDLLDLGDNISDIGKRLIKNDSRSLLGTPLLLHERPIGGLYLTSTVPNNFSADDQTLLQEIAGQLAIAFYQARLNDQIRQQNIELERRVAERTAQLKAKNQELETFTYTVSHDLKAPLRGIDGYSRLLLEDYQNALPEEGRFFLQNIRTGTDQMNELIDDLLAYSRIDRRELQTTEVGLSTLAESLIAERLPDLQRYGMIVNQLVPDWRILTDAQAVEMSLRNLMDNAIKFTATVDQPVIEIGGHETTETYVLWVRDNGIGFDMKYHERILEIFQRLHRTEDFPGTGIGLAIVKKAMDRIAGRVWAESRVSGGATFYLEIPK